MNTSDITDLYENYVIKAYGAQPLALVRGKGSFVWDADGRAFLDFVSGISVCNLGHCHPAVVTAIQKQAGELMHVSNLYQHPLQGQLAKAISDHAMGGKCFFCNSGAEANEGLIKLARLWGSTQNKHEIITMKKSFHGRTLATLTATGQEKVQKGFHPLPSGFVYATFNDLNSVEAAITDQTAAVLLEVVQGEGGIIVADESFIKGLRKLCTEKKILLLIDEIQSGMGRTGYWFAHQHYDIVPDAISMAKAVGNGFPIGCICTAPTLSDIFQPGSHGTTFGGTPLACAAAIAVFETMSQEGFFDNVREKGRYLQGRLNELAEQHASVLGTPRGLGLMLAVPTHRPAAPLIALLRENNLLALLAGPHALRLLPPLTVSTSEIDSAIEKIDAACTFWEKQPAT